MEDKNIRFLDIYKSFFIVGLLTIGGGIAMLPIIEKEIIDKKKWADASEVLEAYSLAQSIPGVIASNTAAFLGYRLKGIVGAIVATLGVITPSVLIIIAIAAVFSQVAEYKIVENAFKGFRVAVLALLLNAIVRMVKEAIIDYYTVGIAIISFVLVMGSFISPILVIIGAAFVGILIYYRKV
ncbi:MAG: chromate transporter [Eubacteriales bacterium]